MTTGEFSVRVWVEDVWDTVRIAVEPEWSVTKVKEEALREAIGTRADPAEYLVKLRGGLVLDEDASLSQLNVSHLTSLSVMAAKRRPVS
ncbi:MAG: hypothetical protein JSW51_08280 [Gemmatimonadota bacterium]|nr:MAG: hypothetical protein JSW51_08280 [Gemmatimonadota bacterium]